MDFTTVIIYIFVAVIGIMVGSFLNVCILRIPEKESVVTVPSHCTSCQKRLKWWELIPIFSYVALRGKCSKCKVKISPQYPIIEAINGILWVLTFWIYGVSFDTLLGVLLASVLLVLSVIDARTLEIPIQTTIFTGILGLARLVVNYENWLDHLLGFLVITVFLIALVFFSKGRAIGGGDVKLMAGCGLFLGLLPTLLSFFLACFLGSIIHIVRIRFFGASRTLAMGPYLALGVFISFLWGDVIISWYMGLLGV